VANRLNMAVQQTIITLAEKGWSYRRIAAALGVDRDTVARYAKAAETQARAGPPEDAAPGSNAAISIAGFRTEPSPSGTTAQPSSGAAADSNAAISMTGSEAAAETGSETSVATPGVAAAGRRSQCQPYRAIILEFLERGLSAQRIWQDLRDEHGFADGYQSVQRFVRGLRRRTPLPFRRMECAPGEEAQIDFGKGAPILLAPDDRQVGGKPRHRRTHVLRIVLSHSRKAYSEVVTRQTADDFIRCLENAFWHFGGVPKTLVVDNLKAAVLKADWFDPELNPKLQAFCQHYGTVVLPTRPAMPRHKGYAPHCTSLVDSLMLAEIVAVTSCRLILPTTACSGGSYRY